MQQGHAKTWVVAAATSCVCPKFRNEEATSIDIKVTRDPFTALSTIWLILEQIARTYSPKTTPVAH